MHAWSRLWDPYGAAMANGVSGIDHNMRGGYTGTIEAKGTGGGG